MIRDDDDRMIALTLFCVPSDRAAMLHVRCLLRQQKVYLPTLPIPFEKMGGLTASFKTSLNE